MKERKNLCGEIHHIVNKLNRYNYNYQGNNLPKNGIYIIFEKNEIAHNGDRIVHIGTHQGDNRLFSRLNEIFKIENKDRSILRKNIGRAILNQNKDPYIDVWNIDFTSRKNKELYGNNIDESHQIYIEKLVTKYIQENLTFVVIEIEDKQHRTQIKKNLIGEISNCNKCKRSKHWIGNYSTKDNIIESGLWHDKELYKGRFEVEDLLFINK